MTAVARTETPLEALTRLTPLIRENASVSESQHTLAQPLVDAFVENGLFRLITPRSLSGAECDALSWYRFLEAAARLDGSTGWCLFINGVTMTLGRTLPAQEAEAIIGNPRTVIAGAVYPFNKAVATPGGYRVTGRWPFASGCKHATYLMGFCVVHDGDTARQNAMGQPDIRTMIVPAAEVEILETWDVAGFEGTGSHDIAFHNVFVPEARSIPLAPLPPNRHYEGALYRLPFVSLFNWPIAAVALGIAQHAIDIATELAATKTPAGQAASLQARPLFHAQLADAVAAVRSARAWLHEALAGLQATAQAGVVADLPARVNGQLAASNATRSARQAIELMFLAAGGTAVYRESELQRCLRDVFALSQHAGTAPATWAEAGAILAGNPPQSPLILL